MDTCLSAGFPRSWLAGVNFCSGSVTMLPACLVLFEGSAWMAAQILTSDLFWPFLRGEGKRTNLVNLKLSVTNHHVCAKLPSRNTTCLLTLKWWKLNHWIKALTVTIVIQVNGTEKPSREWILERWWLQPNLSISLWCFKQYVFAI